jgi:hypothetical protein
MRVFSSWRKGEASGTRVVPDGSSARAVAPNGVRDCEWSRVPCGSDEMEFGWGERVSSWEMRARMPAKWRYVWARRVVTWSLAAMTSGGAN